MSRPSLMKTIGVSWSSSILMRILVTFLAILIPLYGLGVIFYDSAMRVVRKEIMDSMVSQVTFYLDDLEKEMVRVRSLQNDMINDVYLDKLAAIPQSLSEIEKMQVIQGMQRRMEAIRSSSRYVSNFTIYLPGIQRTVTDRGVDELDEVAYQRLLDLLQPTALLQYDQGSLLMMTVSPYMDNLTGKPMYLLVLELSPPSFAEALNQFDKYPGSGSFLIDTSTGHNIATANIDAGVEQQIIEHSGGAAQGILRSEKNNQPVQGFYGFARSASLDFTLAMYIPENVLLKPLRQHSAWFVVFTITALVTIAVFAYSMHRFIHKPLMELVEAFEKVEQGKLDSAIEHHSRDEFRYLYSRFNAMVENLRNLIQQVYTMRILTQRAELKQLQSQINPHFLYNSFFILHRRIKGGDYDNAIAFSQQLGNYFRFITRNAQDEVPLYLEVEHARIYAQIQQIRFTSRLCVHFEELPERMANVVTPRLILQPLVENAFEHGLENKASGGLLDIGFVERESALAIVVQDNGDNLSDEELNRLDHALKGGNESPESTGVLNIHRRLQLRFGAAYGIAVSRSELGGLRVEIILPMGEE